MTPPAATLAPATASLPRSGSNALGSGITTLKRRRPPPRLRFDQSRMPFFPVTHREWAGAVDVGGKRRASHARAPSGTGILAENVMRRFGSGTERVVGLGGRSQ